MYLVVACPRCGVNYRIAPLASLPQPSRLTVQLADLYYTHKCQLPVGSNA